MYVYMIIYIYTNIYIQMSVKGPFELATALSLSSHDLTGY